MATNCSSEHSLLRLKIIKNRLRTSISEIRLVYLLLMTTESDILTDITFDDVTEQFLRDKPRKKLMKL